MISIKLKIFGSFLSGRSQASALVEELFSNITNAKSQKIEVDFDGVDNVTQSFISELFFQLSLKQINLDDIVVQNLKNEAVHGRVRAEIHRLKAITCSL